MKEKLPFIISEKFIKMFEALKMVIPGLNSSLPNPEYSYLYPQSPVIAL
jgi:hypothetical protein